VAFALSLVRGMAPLALALFSVGIAPAQAQQEIGGTQLKAAFFLNFVKFVEWPSASLASPDAPLVLDVIADPPLAAELRKIIVGQKIGSHPVLLQQDIKTPEQTVRVHAVFVGHESGKSMAAEGLLTVSDLPNFVRDGGIIGMVLEDRRYRFDVNMKAAGRAGLKMSSKLLSLARNVVQ